MMAMTNYEKTKLFRRMHPAYRKIERNKHYAKYTYGQPRLKVRYTEDDIRLILTKTMNGMIRPDHVIAKVLRRSLRSIHVYRCALLRSKNSPLRWKALVTQLRKEGRIWQNK